MADWNPPQYLAKVDATENKEVAERFEIKGFPTLKFFRGGNATEYNGGRNEAAITGWIKKKTGAPSEVVSGTQFLQRKDKAKKAIAYIGPLSGAEFEAHQAAAKSDLADVFEFFHTSDTVTGFDGHGVWVLRSFDEPVLKFTGDANASALEAWARSKQTAKLINFDEESIDPIFGQKKHALMLFSNENNQNYQKVFAEAAEKFQGEILFVKSTTTDGIQQKLADYIGVDAKAAPTIRLVKFTEDDMLKFKWEGNINELTVDSIGHYIQDFKNGNLKPFLKSEAIPEKNDGPVTVVVGHNWHDVVGNEHHDVLVKYYAPWCGHCKNLAPIWTELGQYVEGLDEVVIAKMDSTANEVAGVAVRSYPTLIWYPKDNKKGIPYQGGRELKDFQEFLAENSPAYRDWHAKKHGSGATGTEEL